MPCTGFRPHCPRRFWRGFACAIVLYAASLSANAVDVVINSSNGTTQLSHQELLAIFTMRQRSWPDGTPITVFVLSTKSTTHARFCKDLLKVFPHQLQTIWDRLVYSGSGTAPIELKTGQALLEKLAATPGGIGYMESSTSDTQSKTVVINDNAGR